MQSRERIHIFKASDIKGVDGRDKPDHDEWISIGTNHFLAFPIEETSRQAGGPKRAFAA
jgi:hypothetical protein